MTYKGLATSRGIIPAESLLESIVAVIEMGFDLEKNSANDLLVCAAEWYFSQSEEKSKPIS